MLLLFQGDDLPTGVTPFDAASDVPIDEQKSAAMYRIQDHLKKVRPAEAIALLRASRWAKPIDFLFDLSLFRLSTTYMMIYELQE